MFLLQILFYCVKSFHSRLLTVQVWVNPKTFKDLHLQSMGNIVSHYFLSLVWVVLFHCNNKFYIYEIYIWIACYVIDPRLKARLFRTSQGCCYLFCWALFSSVQLVYYSPIINSNSDRKSYLTCWDLNPRLPWLPRRWHATNWAVLNGCKKLFD